MPTTIYVLDANVFIQSKRRHYAFDIAPKFWEALIQHAGNGQIQSIDRVKMELDKGKDDLAKWANSHFHQAFASTNVPLVITNYRAIMNWVNSQSQFNNAAKADFASGADGWLVAYAKSNNYVVVTHEVLNPQIKRQVPIPNVCKAFGVLFINTFEMLRQLKVRFD